MSSGPPWRCYFFDDFRFDFLAVFFFGAFFPSARASESPIAIACLRLVTFLPERPLFNVPALRFFIARSTSADAPLEYFRAMRFLPVDPENNLHGSGRFHSGNPAAGFSNPTSHPVSAAFAESPEYPGRARPGIAAPIETSRR